MRTFNSVIITLLFCAITFTISCTEKSNHENNESPAALTFEEKNNFPDNQLKKDNAKVVRNFAAYTYIIDLEETEIQEKNAEHTGTSAHSVKVNKKEKSHPAKLEQLTPEVERLYKQTPQIDIDLSLITDDILSERPPLFGQQCLTAAAPADCSEKAIQSFINGNLHFPDTTTDYIRSGPTKLVFKVKTNGEVTDVGYRGEKDFCAGCIKTAMTLIKSTSGQWLPALKNGQPVNSIVTIPVQFSTIK